MSHLLPPKRPGRLLLLAPRWLETRPVRPRVAVVPAVPGVRPKPERIEVQRARRHQLGLPLQVQLWLPALLEDPAPRELAAIVECIQRGARVRVRPVSAGYDTSLWCQFPRQLRQPGTRYAVERLDRTQPRRGAPYYRAAGEIRRLEPTP